MNHQELKDLLPFYTVGGLDHESIVEIERHLAEPCNECVAELREWREVVGVLPLGLTPAGPDVSVRERLMASVRQDVEAKSPSTMQPQTRLPHRRPVWVVLPLAAAAVVLLAIGGLRYQKVTREAVEQAARTETTQALLAEEQKKLDERETEVQRLQVRLEEQQATIGEKAQTVTQLETALAEQRQLVSVREQDLAGMQKSGARERVAGENEIATLKAALVRQQEAAVKSAQELGELRATLERQRLLSEASAREVKQLREVLSAPDVRIGTLRHAKAEVAAQGHVLWNASRKAWLFHTFNVPMPPAGKEYQVWFITKKEGPVSAGLFTPDQTGTGLVVAASPPQPFGEVSAVAVTLEPAGGLAKPSGEIYLRGAL